MASNFPSRQHLATTLATTRAGGTSSTTAGSTANRRTRRPRTDAVPKTWKVASLAKGLRKYTVSRLLRFLFEVEVRRLHTLRLHLTHCAPFHATCAHAYLPVPSDPRLRGPCGRAVRTITTSTQRIPCPPVPSALRICLGKRKNINVHGHKVTHRSISPLVDTPIRDVLEPTQISLWKSLSITWWDQLPYVECIQSTSPQVPNGHAQTLASFMVGGALCACGVSSFPRAFFVCAGRCRVDAPRSLLLVLLPNLPLH